MARRWTSAHVPSSVQLSFIEPPRNPGAQRLRPDSVAGLRWGALPTLHSPGLCSSFAGMKPDQTIGELLRQGLISQDEVDAAVDAAAATPSTRHVPVGRAYSLNLLNFLRAHTFTSRILRAPDASQGLKKAALRKVILTARLQNQ